jgi:hypothetical protein
MRTGIVKKIDRKLAIKYFDLYCGWTASETIDQVLTPLADKSLMATTETDPISIMCYSLPASIMKDRKPVKGGNDINAKDYAFAGSVYPKKIVAPRVIR